MSVQTSWAAKQHVGGANSAGVSSSIFPKLEMSRTPSVARVLSQGLGKGTESCQFLVPDVLFIGLGTTHSEDVVSE